MRVFAIGDVHLSFGRRVDPQRWQEADVYKPMDLFGQEWREHYRKIYVNWCDTVKQSDLVLMPGDFSWALKLEQARHDLDFLGLLPGTIVGVAGNHDYWWRSLVQVRRMLPANMRVIQNDHLSVNGLFLCGSRGWQCPSEDNYSQADLRIYRRELIRMENSLKHATGGSRMTAGEIIVLTHFMPVNERHEKSEMIDLFVRYGVSTVVYAHLHGTAVEKRLPARAWGIDFHLVSADYIGFTPKLVREF